MTGWTPRLGLGEAIDDLAAYERERAAPAALAGERAVSPAPGGAPLPDPVRPDPV
jgi:hypothetical protein